MLSAMTGPLAAEKVSGVAAAAAAAAEEERAEGKYAVVPSAVVTETSAMSWRGPTLTEGCGHRGQQLRCLWYSSTRGVSLFTTHLRIPAVAQGDAQGVGA